MDILLTQREHLKLSWQPATCYDYDGCMTYYDTMFGWHGPGATDELIAERKKAWTRPEIPNTINFYIRFRESATSDLFDQIGEMLSQLHGDNHKITTTAMKEMITTRVKPEYVKTVAQAKRDVDAKNEQGRMLLDRLRELKFDVKNVDYLHYETPYEYMEVVKRERDVSTGKYCIGCNEQSEVYQWLNNHGMLEELFPEWYALGRF